MLSPRVILHIDFDYFYAQCEEIRNPSLRTKPVCVCVYSNRGSDSGAIATANYIARKYGAKSGMPIVFAKKRLLMRDDAVFLPVDFDYYSEVSEKAMQIMSEYADVFEYVGRDEAYLDVTNRTNADFGKAAHLAQQIKNAITVGTKLGCSVGVSSSKLVSKIASDFQKPDGLTMVPPQRVDVFLDPLKIRTIPGIGQKTEKKLVTQGAKTIYDLKTRDLFSLTSEFGKKSGTYIYNAARGIDFELVKEKEARIQYSRIVTLEKDSDQFEFLCKSLPGLCKDVHDVIMQNNQLFKSVGIQLVQSDLSNRSKSRMLKNPTADITELLKNTKHLLKEALEDQKIPIRRLGVRVTELSDVRGQRDITSFF